MEFKRKCSIEGFSHFDGNIDGKDLDTLKIYVLEGIKGSAVTKTGGARTVEYKMSPGRVAVLALIDQPFPMEAELTFEMESRMNQGVAEPVLTLTKIEPISATKPGAKAA